jgi:hypothetical protein
MSVLAIELIPSKKLNLLSYTYIKTCDFGWIREHAIWDIEPYVALNIFVKAQTNLNRLIVCLELPQDLPSVLSRTSSKNNTALYFPNPVECFYMLTNTSLQPQNRHLPRPSKILETKLRVGTLDFIPHQNFSRFVFSTFFTQHGSPKVQECRWARQQPYERSVWKRERL